MHRFEYSVNSLLHIDSKTSANLPWGLQWVDQANLNCLEGSATRWAQLLSCKSSLCWVLLMLPLHATATTLTSVDSASLLWTCWMKRRLVYTRMYCYSLQYKGGKTYQVEEWVTCSGSKVYSYSAWSIELRPFLHNIFKYCKVDCWSSVQLQVLNCK